MSDELKERVAKAIEASIHDARLTRVGVMYLPEADAAIALIRAEVLEEAARVAEKTFGEGYHVAAAIRDLKDKP